MSRPSQFSTWMRENLKSATEGLITQDIDYVVFLRDNRFFLIEEKTHSDAKVSPAQAVIAKMLSEIFSKVSRYFLGYFLIYALEGKEPYVSLNSSMNVRFKDFIINLLNKKSWFLK